MMETQNSPNSSLFPQLESILNVYLVQKAPYTLPDGAKRFIVNVGPWISLILLLLTLPIILATFGLAALFSPVAASYGLGTWGIMTTVGLIIALIELVLYGLAIPGLFKKSKVGWNFVFYGSLISTVYAAVSLNILSLVIGTLLSLYILFQIRPYYK